LLDLAPIGIAFADNPECRTIEVNRYGAQIMKIGRTTPPAGDPKVGYRFVRDDKDLPPEDLPLQRAWRTGKPVRDFRATYVPEDGAAFEFHMSSAPVFDKDGRIRRVIGVYDDITRLVTAQAASETRAAQQDFVATTGSLSLRGHSGEQLVAALPEQLARILKIELVKLLVYRPETGDFRLEASYGFQEPRGTIVAGGLNSQAGYTVQSAAPVIVQDLAQEKRFNGPLLLREAGVVSGVSVLIGDPEKPWGVLGVHSRQAMTFTADDIKFLQAIANVIAATVERDSWSRHQRLLLDELRHRVKNSLATVQALASLSFRGRRMTPDVVKGFVARLQTLALAHDLHFEHDGQEVDFEELVRRQVEPYDQQGGRIRISGPARTRLPAGTAIDMAMAVHELVTNAVKHGALSSGEGRVSVAWRRDGEAFFIDWVERGGPAIVGPPERTGYGTVVVATMPKMNLGADIDVLYDRAGFSWRLRCPARMALVDAYANRRDLA
jgi:two-component sensor histidine kinase